MLHSARKGCIQSTWNGRFSKFVLFLMLKIFQQPLCTAHEPALAAGLKSMPSHVVTSNTGIAEGHHCMVEH